MIIIDFFDICKVNIFNKCDLILMLMFPVCYLINLESIRDQDLMIQNSLVSIFEIMNYNDCIECSNS